MTLPQVGPAFHWTGESWGAALRCRALEPLAQHQFTSRQLRLRGGPEAQPHEWTAAAASVGASLDRVARVRQVHGRSVRVLKRAARSAIASSAPAASAASDERPDGDALVSDVPGLVLTVLVADCVPVLLLDRRIGVAAAVHAGWRGTCARVVPAAIDAMTREFGTQPDDLIAAIGPSIRPCCYEVGEERIEAFRAERHAEADIAAWFTRVRRAEAHAPECADIAASSLRLDVARANRDQLRQAGVPTAGIDDCELCTKTYRETFDSYRADRDAAGRMAAMIVVP